MIIPAQLLNTELRFIRIDGGKKIPKDKKWQKEGGNNFNFEEIQKWTDAGGNYGIACGFGNILVIDADDKEFRELLEKEFPDTFTVLSGSHVGIHKYFYCEDGIKPFPIQRMTAAIEGGAIRKKLDKKFGEIKSAGTQAVCPGSLHESGNRYEVLVDKPIAAITKEQINNIVNKILGKELAIPAEKKFSFKKENLKINGRITDIINISGFRITREGYQGSNPFHGSETGQNFCVNIFTNTFYCFRCREGGGILQAVALAEGLINCGEKLRGDDFKKAVSVAREKYGVSIPEMDYDNMLSEFEKGRKETVSSKTKEEQDNSEKLEKISEIQKRKKETESLELKLPEDNLIMRYITHFSKRTDAYPEFHFASAVYLFGLLTDRKVKISLIQGDVFLNTYVQIIGNSTVSRKTAAVNFLERCITDLNLGGLQLSQDYSPEALVEKLSNQPRGSMIIDEGAKFYAKNKRKNYSIDYKYLFTYLYDNKDYSRELRSQKGKAQKFDVVKPFLNVFLSIQPDPLSLYTDEEDLSSGFMPRFIQVFPHYFKRKWLPFMLLSDAIDNEYKELIEDINKINEKMFAIKEVRAMHWEEGAFQDFIERQEVFEKNAANLNNSNVESACGRLVTYALKMAALFSIADPKNTEWIIKREYVVEAWRIVSEFLLPQYVAIIDMIKMNISRNLMEKILYFLKKSNGSASFRTVSKFLHIPKDKMLNALGSLEENGEIIIEPGDKNARIIYLCVDDDIPATSVSYGKKEGKNHLSPLSHLSPTLQDTAEKIEKNEEKIHLLTNKNTTIEELGTHETYGTDGYNTVLITPKANEIVKIGIKELSHLSPTKMGQMGTDGAFSSNCNMQIDEVPSSVPKQVGDRWNGVPEEMKVRISRYFSITGGNELGFVNVSNFVNKEDDEKLIKEGFWEVSPKDKRKLLKTG